MMAKKEIYETFKKVVHHKPMLACDVRGAHCCHGAFSSAVDQI